jgi:hypothetical protein
MTEDEVVQALHKHFDSFFPKVCPNCNHSFATLLEYIQVTKRVGIPIYYDADNNDWNTKQLIGTTALANCPCGSTRPLTTEDRPLTMRLELLSWVRMETQRRGLSPSELLEYLRSEIRKRVLGDLKGERYVSNKYV